MENKFPQLLQIGIMVRDLEEAIKNYKEILGIEGFDHIMDFDGSKPPFEDLTIDGVHKDHSVIRLAIARVYGIELELIEATGESQYSEWMREHGPGIHHIAVKTAEPYEDVLIWYRELKHSEPWVRGAAMGGMMDFSYLDFREELGIIVECYSKLGPGKRGIDCDYEGVPSE